MCGFIGHIGSEPTVIKKNFTNAFDLINHRGPDSSVVLENKNMLLGFKRLAIIDLDNRSNQPFTDGNSYLLFNGEIYNFRFLRDELIAKYPIQFRTEGDAEVLFYGLKYEGENFISKIDGMFAFSFILNEHEVILARDKYGQKPLYYQLKEFDSLSFCSELEALRQLIKPDGSEINRTAIANYLRYGGSIAPETLYNRIMQVVPGESIRINFRTENKFHYQWKKRTARTKLSKTLEDALLERLSNCHTSDVPLAFLSSGGIDSSALINVASRVQFKVPKIAVHLNTKTDPYGIEVAKILQTPDLPLVIKDSGRVVSLDQNEIINLLLKRFGEPFSDSSYLYSEELYSAVPEKYKVLIGGDGADEILKGYKTGTFIFIVVVFTKLCPKTLCRVFLKLYRKSHKKGLILRSILGCRNSLEKLIFGFSTKEINNLMLTSENEKEFADDMLSSYEVMSFYENYINKRLTNIFMRKADRASMQYSKELRSPYLQGDVDDLSHYGGFISYLIPKFRLKLYVLKAMKIHNVFRKKVGFDVYTYEASIKRKNKILEFCDENKSKIEQYFIYENLISIIKNLSRERHLFRVQILLVWITLNEKEK